MDEKLKGGIRDKLGGFFTPVNNSPDSLPNDGQEFDIPAQFKDQS
jgi:hypothetical protein